MTPTDGMDLLAGALPGVQRILIATHFNPDGDAIGSALGLRRVLMDLGKAAEVVIDDPVPEKYGFLVDLPVRHPDDGELDRIASGSPFEMVIFVDASDRQRVGAVDARLGEWAADGAPIVNIDHHVGNEGYGDIVILDPERASSGEMILKIARHLGVPLSPRVASQLYAAVLTDTGRFQFPNTDAAALRAASDLVTAGADPAEISDRIYHQRPPEFYRLVGRLMEGMEISAEGRLCVLVMPSEVASEFFPTHPPDTEGIVDFAVQMRGVELGAFIRQTGEDVWRASLRSRGALDVRSVAEAFGGGGHEKAAGCTLNGGLGAVKASLITAMEGLLR